MRPPDALVSACECLLTVSVESLRLDFRRVACGGVRGLLVRMP